jgi:hypothetical protein
MTVLTAVTQSANHLKNRIPIVGLGLNVTNIGDKPRNCFGQNQKVREWRHHRFDPQSLR